MMAFTGCFVFSAVYKICIAGSFLLLCTKPADDYSKGGSDSILGTFHHDSLRAKIFKTLITSLFEDIWVSN